jgi:predicted NBD/HSP70 family sugar kinase
MWGCSRRRDRHDRLEGFAFHRVGVMSQQLIGVDVGGTKITVASLSDAVLNSPRDMPTPAAGGQALIDEIVQAVESIRSPDAAAVGTPTRASLAQRCWPHTSSVAADPYRPSGHQPRQCS